MNDNMIGLREHWTGPDGKPFTLTQIEICRDCVLVHANGEDGCDDTDCRHGIPDSGWPVDTELTLGRLDADANAMEDTEPWFSWSPCEWCGSPLGGDREYAVAWQPET